MKLYTIKDLEWEEYRKRENAQLWYWEAKTPLGCYRVTNDPVHVALFISPKGKFDVNFTRYKDQAFQSCQEDYEKRLLGCLKLKIDDDQLKIVMKALFVYGQICDDEDGDFKEKALKLLKENNFEL